MKPLHIVVLLAAGAIGGAVIMKVALKPQTAAARSGCGTGTNAAGDRAGHACHGTGGCASHGRARKSVSTRAGETRPRSADAAPRTAHCGEPAEASDRGSSGEPTGRDRGARGGASRARSYRAGAPTSSTRAH